MLKSILFSLIVFLTGMIQAQEFHQFYFKISKPYCVFNYLETAVNKPGTSSTLRDYITEVNEGNVDFWALCESFKSLNLDHQYNWEQLPVSRRQTRSTYDLLVIALVNADNWEDVSLQITGLYPISDQEKLMDLLRKAEMNYDSMIDEGFSFEFQNQLNELNKFSKIGSEYFKKIKQFYNSAWTDQLPFYVALYPIPGESGTTTATPHANSVCVGVLTGEKDHVQRFGVVMHEMCHVLYDEQAADFQHQLAGFFEQNKSPFAPFAQRYFDEGLATALGNGWAYKALNGELDSTEWYSNETINGFAKAIYPLVESYMDGEKVIDQAFVDQAIALFGKTFPNCARNYADLLNACSIYLDVENDVNVEIDEFMATASNYFQFSNTNISSPITDPISLEMMSNNSKTQFIVITQDHSTIFKKIKKQLPELKKVPFKQNSLISYTDKNGRAVIILIAANKTELENLLQKMDAEKYFDENKLLQD
ncbi:MAG: hypothetical protein IT221_13070 [Fluviicola sp.]|nr:hypothetical protein [Fluviicola sp.]